MARDDLDLFYDPPSRWPRNLFFLTLFGMLVGGAWVFAPPLMAKFAPGLTAKIETSLPAFSVARQTAPPRSAIEVDADPQAVTSSPGQASAMPQPLTTAAAPVGNAVSEPVLLGPPPPQPIAAPAFAAVAPTPETTASSSAVPSSWPPPLVSEANNTAIMADEPAEALEQVPLPRRRPHVAATASPGAIPVPRPRPDLGSDEPTPEEIATQLQIERMR